MWDDLIVSVPGHCLSFYLKRIFFFYNGKSTNFGLQ